MKSLTASFSTTNYQSHHGPIKNVCIPPGVMVVVLDVVVCVSVFGT
jgi:hypothetical protein